MAVAEGSQKEVTMRPLALADRDFAEGASRVWWVFLLSGIAWLWVALIVLRLDTTSVTAIAVLFGIVAIGLGVMEFVAMAVSTTGWKIVRAILGVLYIAAGIVAFFEPAGTFVALAALFAWVVLFKGIFDVTVALMGPKVGNWWLILLIGIAEILLAFWAAGYFRGSALLLVAWIAAFALTRGFMEIFTAFRLREVNKELAPA
jgi:uncharacterized membrane protein HdeD (DUF308 family)